MAPNLILTDRWGNPVQRTTLTTEVGGPTTTGVRSPISGYPGDGLNPLRLAEILRAADHGDPIRYMELAEVIEERDPHFLGVIGTRKRAVSQLDITVDAASEDAHDVMLADMVREWLKRDELQQELFHMMDCISKGYSGTEIIWDTSERQYQPTELKYRDPRIFRFNRLDLTTPMMIGDTGREEPLPAFKFIFADIPAKSGLPLRSGLARVATRSSWGGANPATEPFLFVIASAVVPGDAEDAPATARIVLENLDAQMVTLVRSFTDPATVSMAVVMADSPDLIEAEWTDLLLVSADITAGEIVLSLGRDEIEMELFPPGRMTRLNFPGMHL